MNEAEARKLIENDLLPMWNAERTKLDKIDAWGRWDHDKPFTPSGANPEYTELTARAQTPWGSLIVTSVAQTLYVDGWRRPEDPEDSVGWNLALRNGWDARQVAVHRAALTYGYSYATSVPGRDPITGEQVPVMRGVSPREMVAVYDSPADDEWPLYALQVRTFKGGYRLALYTDEHIWRFRSDQFGGDLKLDGTPSFHGSKVVPVVRYTNQLDLEGRTCGEIEPYIPVLGRIDQTVFDRLIVQRFGAWVVRTIAGMDVEASAEAQGKTPSELINSLKVNEALVSEDSNTRFGSLPASPLDGFIRAEESDLTDLAAVSQTPAFELLGQMANMSAEALAAAKSSQTAKSDEAKQSFGAGHSQLIRLGCHQAGHADAAADFRAACRWRDTSIRSLAQAVDAFGKLAQMLGYPPELLWSKVPGMTAQDVDEAMQARRRTEARDVLTSLVGDEDPPRGPGSGEGEG